MISADRIELLSSDDSPHRAILPYATRQISQLPKPSQRSTAFILIRSYRWHKKVQYPGTFEIFTAEKVSFNV